MENHLDFSSARTYDSRDDALFSYFVNLFEDYSVIALRGTSISF